MVRRPELVDFEIRWPNPQEIRLSSALFERNREHGHLLRGLFSVMDGGRMPAPHTATPPFKMPIGGFNASQRASASGLYFPLLTDRTPAGFAVLADSCLSSKRKDAAWKVVRSRKSNELGASSDVPASAYLAAIDTLIEKAMPAERQSAEWGTTYKDPCDDAQPWCANYKG
eukprot:IDg22795t1